jgi:hypothetical protein
MLRKRSLLQRYLCDALLWKARLEVPDRARMWTRNKKWASWVRDFGVTLDLEDANIGLNKLMTYDLFNTSSGHKAKMEHYHAWPKLAYKKPHQVGFGVKGVCIGRVASISSVIRGSESVEVAQQHKCVFKD